MESVTGGLLVINVSMLYAVDLCSHGNVAVLISKVHINYDRVNKQLNIISAGKKLKWENRKRAIAI